MLDNSKESDADADCARNGLQGLDEKKLVYCRNGSLLLISR